MFPVPLAAAGTDVVMQENVEALAWGEDEQYVSCVGSGSVDCPISHRKVYLVKYTYGLE